MAKTAAEIEATIDKLEDAKDQIAAGTKSVTVSYDGRSVTYKSTDLGTINGRIAELRMQLARLSGGPAPRRAFRVQF